MTVEIPLTKGYVAIVDDEDADLVALKWQVLARKTCQYARSAVYENGKQKVIYLHRVVMERKINRTLASRECVDHINHDGLDCRRSNLRSATYSENQHNQRLSRANTSGFKGVCWDKAHGLWVVYISLNGKKIYVGRFASAIEGGRAYNKAALKYHDEFAYLNPIEDLADSADCPAATGDASSS